MKFKSILATVFFLFATALPLTAAVLSPNVDEAFVFLEHRAWDSSVYGNYQATAYLLAGVTVTGLGNTVMEQQTISFLNQTHTLPEFTHGLMPDGSREFSGSYQLGGKPISDFETTYSFFLSGGGLTINESLTLNPGDLAWLDFARPTINGNFVTWNTVDGADEYKILLLDDTGDRVFSSGPFDATSFDLTGQIASGTYTLRVEARKNNADGSSYFGRSTYLTRMDVLPTPIPTSSLFLGFGLLGLVGIRRSRYCA